MTSPEQLTPLLGRCLATVGASLLQFYFYVVELFFPCVGGARCGRLSVFDSGRIACSFVLAVASIIWPIVRVGGPRWYARRHARNKGLFSEAILFSRELATHVRAPLD